MVNSSLFSLSFISVVFEVMTRNLVRGPALDLPNLNSDIFDANHSTG